MDIDDSSGIRPARPTPAARQLRLFLQSFSADDVASDPSLASDVSRLMWSLVASSSVSPPITAPNSHIVLADSIESVCTNGCRPVLLPKGHRYGVVRFNVGGSIFDVTHSEPPS